MRDGGGALVNGTDLQVTVTGGNAPSATNVGVGHYRTTVSPAANNRRVMITANATVNGQSITASRTALVLQTVAPGWNQPEAVSGLVNTAGYEDGPEVSPDGQWLIVSSYSFVNAFCCLTGCGLPVSYLSDYCQSSVGPSSGPERPGMFGADRITSPTSLRNTCSRLCFEGPGGSDITVVPLVPVAAYGFRRQPDGSFAEPFIIGFDADGCGGPFGFSFTRAAVGNQADAVFSFSHFTDDNDVYWTPLTLGQPNILATYSCSTGTMVESGFVPTRIPITAQAATQGNPSFRNGHLFYDDEYTSNPKKILYSSASETSPTATFSAALDVPVVPATEERIQPHQDGNRLYFTRDLVIASAEFNGDPTVAGSWGPVTDELGANLGGTEDGDILAIGEPSIAHPAGLPDELYFVFARRSGAALEFDVGRVAKR